MVYIYWLIGWLIDWWMDAWMDGLMHHGTRDEGWGMKWWDDELKRWGRRDDDLTVHYLTCPWVVAPVNFLVFSCGIDSSHRRRSASLSFLQRKGTGGRAFLHGAFHLAGPWSSRLLGWFVWPVKDMPKSFKRWLRWKYNPMNQNIGMHICVYIYTPINIYFLIGTLFLNKLDPEAGICSFLVKHRILRQIVFLSLSLSLYIYIYTHTCICICFNS